MSMNVYLNWLALAWLLSLAACGVADKPKEPIFQVAFGSCAHQDKPQPMLRVAAALSPDAFVFLGDNIYGDTRDMDTLRAKYSRLSAKPEFRALKERVPLYAVWDDHDYGENDAGRHYPFKEASKDIFMDFWEVPAQSPRRGRPGIYGMEWIEKEGLRVQLLLLDTRTFRDGLLRREPTDTLHFKNDYRPNGSPDSTFLGEAQWAWLETALSLPADLRVIASSNQFSHTYNGWESWNNVPHERARMLETIRKTGAEGVVFISGDVHWGEISRQPVPVAYPIYDVTSSGITETWPKIEPNANRVGEAVPENNIGLISVQAGATPTLTLSLIGSTGQARSEVVVPLDELSFKTE